MATLDGVSSFAVTGASVSQMTTLAGLNFVTHLEIRDGIANLEGFTPDPGNNIPSGSQVTVHAENATVLELSDTTAAFDTWSLEDSVDNILTNYATGIGSFVAGAQGVQLNAASALPISFAEMVILEQVVSSFPDSVPMAVADTAQSLMVGFDSANAVERLALYDTDTLTLVDDTTDASNLTI